MIDLKGKNKNDSKNDSKNDVILHEIKTLLNLNDDTIKTKSLVENVKDISISKTEDKDKIKFRETITKIMVAAEESNIMIKIILTKKYAELLREKLGEETDAKQHKDYRYYQVIIANVLDDIKRNTLKQSVKGNDLVTMSDIEFDEFVKRKSEIMVSIVAEYLDFMYNGNSGITREILQRENETCMGEIKDVIATLYRQIKHILHEDQDVIDKIQGELDSEVDNIFDRHTEGSVVKMIKKVIEDRENEKD